MTKDVQYTKIFINLDFRKEDPLILWTKGYSLFLSTSQEKEFSVFEQLIKLYTFQKIYNTMTQCQDEFRSLSGSVTEILTACRMHQILIAWCQIEAEIRGFPTMYTMRGGKYSKNWRKTWFCPNFRPKTPISVDRNFEHLTSEGSVTQNFEISSSLTPSLQNMDIDGPN